LSVRAGPHVVAGLRGDDQLVAVGAQIGREQATEVLLGGAVRRAVVVGQVEVRDAEVEGTPDDGAAEGERTVVAGVVPEPERDRGQLQAAPSATTVGHALVPAVRGRPGHRPRSLVAARYRPRRERQALTAVKEAT